MRGEGEGVVESKSKSRSVSESGEGANDGDNTIVGWGRWRGDASGVIGGHRRGPRST